MAEKPTFVLVHGAWHSPEAWTYVIQRLHKAGFACESMQLPSVSQHLTFDDDVATVRAVLHPLIEQGKDVVLVGHSYGGAVIGNAAKDLHKGQVAQGGIIHKIYVAAFMLPEGTTVGENSSPPSGRAWIDYDPTKSDLVTVTEPAYAFYGDLPPAEQEKWAAKLKLHPFSTWTATNTIASHLRGPSTYVSCARDNAIRPETQEAMIAKALAAGAPLKVARIESDHSPFLCKPDEITDIFIQAATQSA